MKPSTAPKKFLILFLLAGLTCAVAASGCLKKTRPEQSTAPGALAPTPTPLHGH